jgi:ferredoxin-NADP reductase
MKEETFRFQVDRITPESSRVKTFRLRPGQAGMPFRFSPGQHMGVRPIDTESARGGSDQRWRHFSLSSSPSEPDFLEITVLRQGTASDRIHSLSEGDWVEVTRPEGQFVFDDAVRYGPVFFGGGIGTAPVRSMVRYCLDQGLGKALDLFASFSSPEEALFKDELKKWGDRTGFYVWLTYTGTQAARDGRSTPSHPWDRAYLEERIERPLDRVYYLCAPRGLMDTVESHLAAMGIPPERVRSERW